MNLPIFCGHSANFIHFSGAWRPLSFSDVVYSILQRVTLYSHVIIHAIHCIRCICCISTPVYTVNCILYMYTSVKYIRKTLYTFRGLHFLNIEPSGCVFKVSRFYLNLSFILGFSLVLNA